MELQTIGIIIIVIALLFFLFFQIKKKRDFQKLITYLGHGDYEHYMALLDSPFMKLAYPAFNIQYMKLNAYLMMDMHKEIQASFDTMLQKRLTKKQRMDIVNKAFHYYTEQKDKSHAKAMLAEIKTFQDETLIQESEILYNIFIMNDYQYISEMEQQLTTMEGARKGYLEYLLAQQYENKNDPKKSKYYLKLAQKHMIPTKIQKKQS